MTGHHVLTLSCPDRPGLTSAVTQRLFQHRGNVVEAQQFGDAETERFFMRIVADFADDAAEADFRQDFAGLAGTYGMEWALRRAEDRRRVLIFVSKFDHCLNDLLYRYRMGELAMDLAGIVSNHPAEAAHWTGELDVPFHHLP
ncbi:MAG: ACT domain-containing protein, partial [Pseudomonadota bacterium]